MKKLTLFIFALLWIVVGCVSPHQTQRASYDGSYWATGPTLARQLEKIGLTQENCVRMVAKGDESSLTSGLSAELEDPTFIWDRMFRTAEPYTWWEASGNRTLELYQKGSNSPTAILLVNATDRTTIKGMRGAYMCRDLENTIMQSLKIKGVQPSAREDGIPPPQP